MQAGTFYADSAKEMASVLFKHWLPGFAILSLGGIWVLRRKFKNLFWGFSLLFAPIFLGIFAIHEQQNIYLLPAYLVSLTGLMLLFGYLAIVRLISAVNDERGVLLVAIIMGVLSIGWLDHVLQSENKSAYTLSEDFGINILKELPKGAILLADGDHYVMPIWYEQYVKGLRADIIFKPSVFLFHGWGWKQLGDQSEDLKPLIASSDLFQDRLDLLTKSPGSHPLFYSLGRDYLKSAIDKMPGFWVPRGLVYAWEPQKPSRDKEMREGFQIVGEERMRCLPLDWTSLEMDPSSQQIYCYYNDQLTLLNQ
jgi:hypothetical protein